MNGTITLEQVELLIAQLSPREQLRLFEGLGERLNKVQVANPETVVQQTEQNSVASHDWMALRGIAPALLEGQDAQTWVSQTRREADEQRERQWRRTS